MAAPTKLICNPVFVILIFAVVTSLVESISRNSAYLQNGLSEGDNYFSMMLDDMPEKMEYKRSKRAAPCNAPCTLITGCKDSCVCDWIVGVCLPGTRTKKSKPMHVSESSEEQVTPKSGQVEGRVSAEGSN